VAGVEDVAEPVEEPVDPVIGLVGVVVDDAEPVPLVGGHGIDHPGHLHHVALVVPGQSVELGGNKEAPQADRAGPADLGVDQRCNDRDDAGAVYDTTSGLEVRMRCGPPTVTVDWGAAAHRPPRSAANASSSGRAGTNSNRSDRTVTPWSPAARASSGNLVPMARWLTNQVERSREAENLGHP
jgi:hypothetical protein